MTVAEPRHFDFVQRNTAVSASRLVPGIALHLADEATALWQATEDFLQRHNLAPPFWAFAWPGSEALARYVADHPERVAGLRVLDFAAGSGLAAIAAAQAGARVEAAEIDPFAVAAISLNASLNSLNINVLSGDIVGAPCAWDVILCGDVCYEARMANHILPWLRQCARQACVILADPGRKYAPAGRSTPIARYVVPTSLALEDASVRDVTLSQLLPD